MTMTTEPLRRHLPLAAVIAALALGGAACDQLEEAPAGDEAGQEAEHPDDGDDGDEDYERGGRFSPSGAFVPNSRILMAFRDIGPPKNGDNGFAIRERTPEEHALTEAPTTSRAVRPMVEWEPMSALMMAFPAEFLSDQNATETVVQIARYASDFGDVWLMVDHAAAETGLRQRLINAGVPSSAFGTSIHFHRTTLDSIWLIDYAPFPIIDTADDTYAFADFRYYYDRAIDDGLPTRLGRFMDEAFGVEGKARTYRMPLDTEGGTIQSTSDGICFTSSRQLFHMSCLDEGTVGCDERILSMDLPTMQTSFYANRMRQVLADYLGCQELIITHSVSDDGTGHLDMYFKLLDDDRILLGEYRAPFQNVFQEQNSLLMDENAAFLEAWVRPGGDSFLVERIIMPGHQLLQGFGQVPFTYINATFFNGLNLWPATNFPEWEASRAEAQATWERVLPDMTHRWVDATNLSFYSGAIHCITRTLPALAIGDWVADGVCDGGSCQGPEGGYSGACDPAAPSICFGPEWLCDCNDCEGQCQDPCRGIAWEGCCDGGNVVTCENGFLNTYDCQRTGCGWNQWGGFYDCDESGAEPTGTFPLGCEGCEPRCDGRVCGDDGCGGTCGSCEGDRSCLGGQCSETCFECTPGASGCEGNTVWICDEPVNGCRGKRRFDCADFNGICVDGDCQPLPDTPGPDAAPDAGPEPHPEGPGDVGADTDPEGGGSSRRSGGCGAGGGGSALWLLPLLAIGAFRRRRGVV